MTCVTCVGNQLLRWWIHFIARIVDPSCKEEFNPDKMKTAYPSYNTQAGEQTFVWVSRFKHSIYSVR